MRRWWSIPPLSVCGYTFSYPHRRGVYHRLRHCEGYARGNLKRSPRRFAPRDDGLYYGLHPPALRVLKIIPARLKSMRWWWSIPPSLFAGILLPTRIVGAGVAGSGRRQNNLCSSGIISLIY